MLSMDLDSQIVASFFLSYDISLVCSFIPLQM